MTTTQPRAGLSRGDYEKVRRPDAHKYPLTTEETLSELLDRGYRVNFRQLIHLIDPKRSDGQVANPQKRANIYLWDRAAIDAVADHLETKGQWTLMACVRAYHQIHPLQESQAFTECLQRTGIDNPKELAVLKMPVGKSGYAEVMYFSPEEIRGFIDYMNTKPNTKPRRKPKREKRTVRR